LRRDAGGLVARSEGKRPEDIPVFGFAKRISANQIQTRYNSGSAGCPLIQSTGGQRTMDFIERLLGISPDAGTGVTELTIVLVPLLAIGLFAMRRRFRRRS